MRRNPNDAPDVDFSGYDSWLTKLNHFNGNFIDAEMVKAFISSIDIGAGSDRNGFIKERVSPKRMVVYGLGAPRSSLVLAAMRVDALIFYSVTQQTREIFLEGASTTVMLATISVIPVGAQNGR